MNLCAGTFSKVNNENRQPLFTYLHAPVHVVMSKNDWHVTSQINANDDHKKIKILTIL